MKKLFILTALLFFFSIGFSCASGSQVKPSVVINGTRTNTDVRIIDGKPYVDAVAYSQAAGLKAEWDGKSSALKVTSASNDVIIPEIIESVSPSVVGIIGRYDGGSPYQNQYNSGIAFGTGVIITSDGQILTNAHVVKDLYTIITVLSNGDGYVAALKYIDEDSDLAVIKIEKNGLAPVKFGSESEITTGKTVIAIGTPTSFSLRNSASIGVISGVNRGIGSYYKLIQTDASINPGNSGGPLVGLQGNVIGINSMKFVDTEVEGMGFSIPVGTIRYVLDQFKKYGRVKRPHTGAAFEEDWAAKLGLPSNKGLSVTGVEQGSPAVASGLKPGDVLVRVGNVPVNTIVDYNEVMKSFSPNQKAEFKIKRGNTEKSVIITFDEE